MLLTAPDQADALVDQIIQTAARLADFPRMGRKVPYVVHHEAREIIVGRYHLVYTTDGEEVQIATILHGAMDVASRLSELLGDDA